MNYDVRAPFDRAQKERTQERVVDDQTNAAFARQTAYAFQVAHDHGGFGPRLDKNHPGFFSDLRLDVARLGRVDVAEFHPEISKHMLEQAVGPAVSVLSDDGVIS